MRFLITGATGQLGYDIALELEHKGYKDILKTNSGDMDITDEKSVKGKIESYRPNVIFHCAAYTAIDKAKNEKEQE